MTQRVLTARIKHETNAFSGVPVVIDNRFRPQDRMFFVRFGVTPKEKSAIAAPDPRKFPFKNPRRPIWPLEID